MRFIAREWVYSVAQNTVTHGIFSMVYGSAFLFATVLFHIHCIANEKNEHPVENDEYQMLAWMLDFHGRMCYNDIARLYYISAKVF